jgi:chaperone modulatory protein CbpM
MMTQLAILYINFEELCKSVSISEDMIIALIEYGIVVPAQGDIPAEWLFSITAVSVAKKAVRIHQDLAINWASIPLVLDLLTEIETLQMENAHLKNRLNRFTIDEL